MSDLPVVIIKSYVLEAPFGDEFYLLYQVLLKLDLSYMIFQPKKENKYLTLKSERIKKDFDIIPTPPPPQTHTHRHADSWNHHLIQV